MTPALSNPSDPLLVAVVAVVALALMVLSRFARRWVPKYEEPGQDSTDLHAAADHQEDVDRRLKEWRNESAFARENNHRSGAD
jgi:hypothetical protein